MRAVVDGNAEDLRRSVPEIFEPGAVEALFFHDCPAEAVAFARARLRPQPVAPARTMSQYFSSQS